MSDGGNNDRPRRAQSQTERDIDSPGLQAALERKSKPMPTAVPEFVDEVDTGVMAMQERLGYREGLSDRQRIRKLEKHVDAMKTDIASIKTDVAVTKAETTGQTKVLNLVLGSVQRLEKREDTVFEIKGEIHKATEVAKTEVAKTEQVTAIEDKADAKKLSRKAWAAILGGTAGVVELLHQLVSHLR